MRANRRAMVLSMLLSCSALWAGTGSQQWRVDTWDSRVGLSSDSLNMVLALHDGRLLVTSFYAPPAVFDGHEFSPLHVLGDKTGALSSATVAVQADDGSLWFGTRLQGLLRMDRDGALEILALTDSAERTPDVRALLINRAGDLLVGTSAGLFVVEQVSAARRLLPPPSELSMPISALLEDRSGRLWVGTDNGLYWRESGRTVRVAHPPLDAYLWTLYQDEQGRIWVGTRGNGAQRLDAQGWRGFGSAEGLPNDVVRRIVGDGADAVWVATAGGGVAHLRDDTVDGLIDSRNGLPGDSIYWLLPGEDELWLAGPGIGLNRVRPSAFSNWSAMDGLTSGFVWSLYVDSEGALWAGGNAGFSRRSRDGISQSMGRAGPGQQAVSRCFLELDMGMLIGTEGGLFLRSGGELRQIPGNDSAAVMALLRTADGSVLVGGDGLWQLTNDPADSPGLGQAKDSARASPQNTDPKHAGMRLRALETPWPLARITALQEPEAGLLLALADQQGLWTRRDGEWQSLGGSEVPNARSFWLDPDGRSWIAGRHLACVAGDGCPRTLSTFATQHARGLHALLPDQLGGLWIPSNSGLYRFAVDELRRFARSGGDEPVPQRFDRHDGLTSSEFNGGSQTPAVRDDQGLLWFASTNGVAQVDPRRLRRTAAKLRVAITGIEIADQWLRPAQATVLPAGTSRVVFNYTALPAAVGEEASFSYRLRPLMQDWVQAGSDRHALFPALGAGEHQFEVRAVRPGHSEAVAAQFSFRIEPAWWERWSIRLLIAVGLISLAAALPLGHIRALRQQRERLLAEVADKTRALEEMAATDGLTGLANRRSFDNTLQQALHNGAVSLLLIDVDHFKRFNDALGHQAGDHCLIEIAQLVGGGARRDDDLAARLGGEEFGLLLPRADLDDAAKLAENLHQRLRESGLTHPDSPLGALVTVSVGCAKAALGTDPADLYRRADAALYAAKAGGRSRTVVDREGSN